MESSVQPILAEVVEVLSRTGPGGSCRFAKVVVKETKRSLIRVIDGPIRKGDHIYLLEAERDQKVGRR
ncbi:small subunit ribosomal protein S28e [Nematocida sp. AWRm77]|nr:small subunit ribosomal protein S28e [Nematocida sp. AWRm77]